MPSDPLVLMCCKWMRFVCPHCICMHRANAAEKTSLPEKLHDFIGFLLLRIAIIPRIEQSCCQLANVNEWDIIDTFIFNELSSAIDWAVRSASIDCLRTLEENVSHNKSLCHNRYSVLKASDHSVCPHPSARVMRVSARGKRWMDLKLFGWFAYKNVITSLNSAQLQSNCRSSIIGASRRTHLFTRINLSCRAFVLGNWCLIIALNNLFWDYLQTNFEERLPLGFLKWVNNK